jgi:esterase
MALAHALLTAPDATPSRWMLFLHGILGSGSNWRTFAKQVIEARPEWGAVLVDLRLHGESLRGFDAPHTVRASAADLDTLVRELGVPVGGVLAHSFGGKVAIAYAELVAGALDHVFIVDSSPAARPDRRGSEGTQAIVDLLMTLPDEFPDRAAFTAYVEERGVSRPIAMWLAMNVKAVTNTTRYVFRLDVRGIRELLDDYFRTDLWPVLEAPPGKMRTHFIVGETSTVVDESDRHRAATCPRTSVDIVRGAGHWVHVDAPDALRAIVLGHLATH